MARKKDISKSVNFGEIGPKNYVRLTEYIETYKPKHYGHIKKYAEDLYYCIPYIASTEPAKKSFAGGVAMEKFSQVRIKMDKALLDAPDRRKIILEKIDMKVSEVPEVLLPKTRDW